VSFADLCGFSGFGNKDINSKRLYGLGLFGLAASAALAALAAALAFALGETDDFVVLTDNFAGKNNGVERRTRNDICAKKKPTRKQNKVYSNTKQ